MPLDTHPSLFHTQIFADYVFLKNFFSQLQTLSNTLVHILMHRLQSLATLTGVQWCLAVVLPCTSLMARDGEHLPTRQFGISPGEVFSPFAQTTDLKLFVSLLLHFQCSLYSLGNRFFFFSQTYLLKMFSARLWETLSRDNTFCRAEIFNFNDVQIIISFMSSSTLDFLS